MTIDLVSGSDKKAKKRSKNFYFYNCIYQKYLSKFGLFEKGTKAKKKSSTIYLTILSNVKFKAEDFFKFCALLKKSELYPAFEEAS